MLIQDTMSYKETDIISEHVLMMKIQKKVCTTIHYLEILSFQVMMATSKKVCMLYALKEILAY